MRTFKNVINKIVQEFIGKKVGEKKLQEKIHYNI